MNPRRAPTLALFAVLGVAVGLPIPAHADDTEIYLGNPELAAGLRPNILFVLDTSGSMGSEFDGQPENRLTRMKQALNLVLDQVDNVNVGLMTFGSQRIVFPVTNINADSSAKTLLRRVTDSSDDAEENIATGAMKLTDPALEATTVPTFAVTTTLVPVPVTDPLGFFSGLPSGFSANDTSELVTGPVPATSFSGPLPDAPFGNTLTFSPGFNTAMRFENLQIPVGATVTHAAVSLEPQGAEETVLTKMVFSGHKVANSPDLPNGFEALIPVPVPASVLDRLSTTSIPPARTTATTNWDPVPIWAAGSHPESPELKNIAQEIIDLPGWAPGNAMTFMVQTSEGLRRAQSIESTASFGNAAIPQTIPVIRNATGIHRATLHLEYQSSGAPGEQIIGLRFRDVRLPQGIKIEKAVLELRPSADSTAAVDIRIEGEQPSASTTPPGSAPPFTATARSITSRTPVGTHKDWRLGTGPGDAWTEDDPVQTPNLKEIVQDIVDDGNWCGGNDMVFALRLRPTAGSVSGPRSFHSFDQDPNFAPVLRVKFKPRTTSGWRQGNGCTVAEVTRQVNASNNDAEQDQSLGSLSLVSPTLEFFTDACCTRSNGLRFTDLRIPRNTGGTNVQILNASVTLTAAQSGTDPTTMSIYAQNIGDAPVFDEGSDDVLTRMASAAQLFGPISWSSTTTPSIDVSDSGVSSLIPGWTAGEQYTSPDISTLVQDVVNGTGWASGQALALLLDGAGKRVAHAFDGSPAGAARLRVKFRVNLASVAPSERIFNTVRQTLKEVVNGITSSGGTPIVDSLYEAARYFAGKPLDFGAQTAPHEDSYIDGDVATPAGCVTFNPDSAACAGTTITGDPVATYVSPITDACQANFVVLLTDGDATVNRSVAESPARLPAPFITSVPAVTSCATALANGDPTFIAGSLDDRCGIELTKFMHEEDQRPTPDGIGDSVNTVTTYTIGFAQSSQWLRDLADAGGGDFFTATNAEDLATVFQQIFSLVLARTTSFAAPSLSINAFNKLFHRDEVYFSLFKPSEFARWPGNVKKYKIRTTCQDPTGAPGATLSNCEVGEIIDAKTTPEPVIGEDQRIRSTALSEWTDTATVDGSAILSGGAGVELIDDTGTAFHTTRKVFTWIGSGPPATPVLLHSPAPAPAVTPNLYLEIKDANGDGILDGLPAEPIPALITGALAGYSPGDLARLERTRTLLGFTSGSSVAQLFSAGDTAGITSLAQRMRDQINWIRGVDVDNEDSDTSTTDDRYSFTDPLHSSPVAITYGSRDPDNPATPNVDEASNSAITKLFVGTNDGGIRMLNASDEPFAGGNGGKEQWIFYPQITLPVLLSLRRNLQTPQHKYGTDGTPTVWVNDVDGDGTINPSAGDFVRMYIGMRRGGNQLFAFDVTPDAATHPTGLTDPSSLTDIVPTLLWRIDGGGVDYPRLGQTWSRPQLTTIRYGTTTVGASTERKVLIFAGGYDSSQDGGFGPGGTGNAIYIVDAVNGERLLSVSNTRPVDAGGAVNLHDLAVADMTFPIPSDVALLDSDGDGATDRVYVGDTGGQMWRLDLAADTRVSEIGITATIGKLASVSAAAACTPPTTQPNCDRRKFFYPPDVVQVRNDGGSSATNYDLVVAVTGQRPSPLDASVQDRAYGFKDLATGAGALIGFDTAAGGGPGDGVASSLEGFRTLQGPLDTTVGDLFDVTDPTARTTNASGFRNSEGWYLDFAAPGEKALAAPVVLAGKLFFTTYLPEGVVANAACAIPEGGGNLYGIDVLTGEAVFNWDSTAGAPRTAADRTMQLGAGIPSGAVPIFQPEAVTLLIGGGGGATTVDPNIALPRQRTYWFQQ